MELWIRSQDKMKLVNNCNLYISNEIRNEYVIEDLNNKYLKLGTYKTKERALEVLDEIQNILKHNLIINSNQRFEYAPDGTPYSIKIIVNNGDNIQELSTYVYDMPEE